jgi:hypothetical protein
LDASDLFAAGTSGNPTALDKQLMPTKFIKNYCKTPDEGKIEV